MTRGKGDFYHPADAGVEYGEREAQRRTRWND